MVWVSLKTLRFLGTRYYTDNKTVTDRCEIETVYRCGGGCYLKWYMIEAVNLRMARIVIHGKEIGLRITPYGQRIYLQYAQRLAECSPGIFEFGGVLPASDDRRPALEFSNRRDRATLVVDTLAHQGLIAEQRRNNERKRRKI